VNRAADAIGALETHARELERTAQQVQSLQHERRAAETRIAELHHQVGRLEDALRAERARTAAAESELERRTRMAEARVAEFENAVRSIEDAIRTKILKEAPQGSRRASAA
jgi:predicted  nucleic acid-binding Zn-ribbon protein